MKTPKSATDNNVDRKTPDKVKFDSATTTWFKSHPDAVTTIRKCEKCGLYYKSSLRHKCKEESNENT